MTSEDIKHHFIVYIKFTSFLVFNMCTPNNNKPAQTDTAADTAAENMSRSPDATQNLQVFWYHAMKTKLCLKTGCWCSHSQQLHVHQAHQFSCL